MTRARSISLAAAAALATLLAGAMAGGAVRGEPQIPEATGYVNDRAGILDAASRGELDGLLRDLERRTTAEVAILTVPSTAPLTIQEYSIAVFDRWKIGKKGKDNGLLFLVAVKDRKLWITTGYGLEAILPDGKVGEIRDSHILPSFRQGRYAEGILRGTWAIAAVIGGGAPGTPQGAPPTGLRGKRPSGRGAPVPPPRAQIVVMTLLGIALFAIPLLLVADRALRRGRSFGRGRRSWGGGYWGGGGFGGGGFSGGDFGGFGGGGSGGGGAGGSW